jgi:hypothetical protein
VKQVSRAAQEPGTDPAWQPTEADLAPWAKVLLEDGYMLRGRQRCSREDYAIGFIGALVGLRWRAAFVKESDELLFPGRKYPLPGLVEAFVAVGPGNVPDIPADLIPRPESSSILADPVSILVGPSEEKGAEA